MNQKEKQYALDRVTAIANSKISAIKAKHTTPGTLLNSEQRLAALKKGEFKLKPGLTQVRGYDEIRDVFTFPGDKAGSEDTKRIEAETDKVQAEATRIKDQLMLGDSQQALDLIDNFSK